MAATTIRIRPQTHKALKEMAEKTGMSLQDVLDQAVKDHRRKIYLQAVNADYAALKKDPKGLASFNKELSGWDITNLDGLEE